MSDQNSRTRLETFGIRPDLFDALQKSSVSKSELDQVAKTAQAATDAASAAARDIEVLKSNGVRGYAGAYMGTNITATRGFFDSDLARRMLPFDTPIGGEVNAQVDPVTGGIRLNEAGLWTVHVNATSFPVGDVGSTISGIFVRVMDRPDMNPKEPATETRVLRNVRAKVAEAGDQSHFLNISFPVVVPEPGWWVNVSCHCSSTRKWLGGTNYSSLAVVKTDNRAVNIGSQTVTDE